LKDPRVPLGNHHHPYREAFVCPQGVFDFVLTDPREPENPRGYQIYTGKRLLIPSGIDHVVQGREGSVLMGFGSVPFDPKKLIGSRPEALEVLTDELRKIREGY
jgi:hypothetical protein